MDIGINIFCCGAVSESNVEQQTNLMLKNGLNHTFGGSDDLSDHIIEKIQTKGIIFDTLHLPFKGINGLYSEYEESKPMFKRITDGIEKCARHGIPLGVLHLSSGKNPPLNDRGIERFCRILDHARELGVKIAFENLRTLGNISYTFEKHEDALFCWDTGHESCFTPQRQYMPLFGKRLATVHLHDNNGIYDKDEHMIPYDGKIDFDRVAYQLSEANYNGTLMLEVLKERNGLYENMTDDEYLKRASEAVLKLEKQIKKHK